MRSGVLVVLLSLMAPFAYPPPHQDWECTNLLAFQPDYPLELMDCRLLDNSTTRDSKLSADQFDISHRGTTRLFRSLPNWLTPLGANLQISMDSLRHITVTSSSFVPAN